MTKKLTPVMLPTTDKGNEGMLSTAYGDLDKPFGELIVLNRATCGNKYFDTDNPGLFSYKPQHLYLVAHSRTIRKGDWLYNDRLEEGAKVFQADENHAYLVSLTGFTKVFASTDPRVKMPTLPLSFLQSYAKSRASMKEVEIHWLQDSGFPYFNTLNEVLVVNNNN